MFTESCAPKLLLPMIHTTISSARPAKPYTHGMFASCHTRSRMNGIIQVISADTATITNWRMALSKSRRVRITKPMHKSMHMLLTRSLDRSG